MKKIFFLTILVFAWGLCLTPPPAAAQTEPGVPSLGPAIGSLEEPKPTLTSPQTVALLYYKLTARAPDFESWIKEKDAYKNASTFDKSAVMTAMLRKLKQAYNAILLTDPVIVETQVALSPYDAKNQGFFVENFKRSTFFPVSYEGQSYAIVPEDIIDKQWLKVEDATVAAEIDKAAAANNHTLAMFLFLTPRYADASSPAVIDGENYWPIAADIKKMMLYPPNSDTLLWRSDGSVGVDKTRQYLLNLYQ